MINSVNTPGSERMFKVTQTSVSDPDNDDLVETVYQAIVTPDCVDQLIAEIAWHNLILCNGVTIDLSGAKGVVTFGRRLKKSFKDRAGLLKQWIDQSDMGTLPIQLRVSFIWGKDGLLYTSWYYFFRGIPGTIEPSQASRISFREKYTQQYRNAIWYGSTDFNFGDIRLKDSCVLQRGLATYIGESNEFTPPVYDNVSPAPLIFVGDSIVFVEFGHSFSYGWILSPFGWLSIPHLQELLVSPASGELCEVGKSNNTAIVLRHMGLTPLPKKVENVWTMPQVQAFCVRNRLQQSQHV